jgi:hypothetical protein
LQAASGWHSTVGFSALPGHNSGELLRVLDEAGARAYLAGHG